MRPAEFDLHATLEDGHWWFRARRDIVFDRLARYLPPGEGRRVFEIGCGTGGNLRHLAAGYEVLGCDSDNYALALAAARSGGRVRRGDFAAVLGAEAFRPDAVLMMDVLEHVEGDAALLARVVAAVPPATLILVTVPADRRLWSAHDIALGHFRRYDAAMLRGLWQGLAVDELYFSAFNFLLYPAIRAVRAVRAVRALRRGAGERASDLRPAPRLANALLYRVFAAERRLLARRSVAFGCSLMAVLRTLPAPRGASNGPHGITEPALHWTQSGHGSHATELSS